MLAENNKVIQGVMSGWSAWGPKESACEIRIRSAKNVTEANIYARVRARVAFVFEGVTTPQ